MLYSIPKTPDASGSYWCTWGIQNSSLRGGLSDPAELAHDGFRLAMDQLNESLLFHASGWANSPFGDIQGDLFVLYDVGWDVPQGTPYPGERWRLGSVEVDTRRFPSCTGTPMERLQKLNALTQAAGWRGAGLWIAPQVVGDRDDALRTDVDAEAYWRERARWSAAAGIGYWKVDIGARGLVPGFRAMMTRIAHEEAPGLLVEHGRNTGPFNDVPVPWEAVACRNAGRFATWGSIPADSLDLVANSDVFRTYDVTGQMSAVTTLDRVAYLLVYATAGGLLNCEDEVTMGAALGCAIGVMRHPMSVTSAILHDDPQHTEQRIDEVRRAVRWQRIAPPVPVTASKVLVSDEVLFDEWPFVPGDTWAGFVNGQTIRQGAPAVVARGMPLPRVQAEGELPFVVASRHPNGAVALATLPRADASRTIKTPRAQVVVALDALPHSIGIFGSYHSLTLQLPASQAIGRIWARDLMGDEVFDITDRVFVEGTHVILPGKIIDDVGRSAGTRGDLSEPGLVLSIIP